MLFLNGVYCSITSILHSVEKYVQLNSLISFTCHLAFLSLALASCNMIVWPPPKQPFVFQKRRSSDFGRIVEAYLATTLISDPLPSATTPSRIPVWITYKTLSLKAPVSDHIWDLQNWDFFFFFKLLPAPPLKDPFAFSLHCAKKAPHTLIDRL